MFARRIAAAFTLLFGASLASAQSGPQLLTVFPPGAKAKETVEVTFAGSGFDGEEKLLFSVTGFKAQPVGETKVDPKAPKGQPAATVKFKVTAPAAGVFDVRVVSKSGLSNPRTFLVGELAEVNETEPNNDLGQAQKIELETTVNGVISAPTDVDFVSFKAKAGQNIVVYCLTTSIDSRLSADILVSTSDGKAIAANRGYRGGDAVLDFKAPSDGEYLVRVAQFAYTTGGPDHFYRLTVTTGPWVDAVFPAVADDHLTIYGRNLPRGKPDTGFNRPDGRPFDSLTEGQGTGFPAGRDINSTGPIAPTAGNLDASGEPRLPLGHLILNQTAGTRIRDTGDNSTVEKALTIPVPCDVAGRIAKKNDRHWYSFDAKKGDVWTIEVFADRIGSQIDAFFILTDEKGKVIVEQDDGPDSLSTNQFFTKSDDPARYRFTVPSDCKYRLMVSSRDAAIQFGVREQYVLRIAKEKPEFRFAIMPATPHMPDAGTLARNSAVLFAVFVFRMDGFNDAITLTAEGLPPGVTCPPQVISAGQTRGTFVLTADKDAKDWDGFVVITGKSDKLTSTARPFTVTWTPTGFQANQPPPNSPMLTRMDRGPGLALAVRGTAPFTLSAVETELKGKAGEKLEVTLKVTRDEKFKDGIAVFSAVPNFGPRQQGNNPLPPLATIAADKSESKVSVDVPANTQPGTYTLVLRGQTATAPKGKPVATYPATPITVVIQGAKK